MFPEEGWLSYSDRDTGADNRNIGYITDMVAIHYVVKLVLFLSGFSDEA